MSTTRTRRSGSTWPPRSARCPTAILRRSTTRSASAATMSPSPSAARDRADLRSCEDTSMTATEHQSAPPRPAKLPREEDPRHPLKRLSALFDQGSLSLITDDDDSGMLAAVGTVDG